MAGDSPVVRHQYERKVLLATQTHNQVQDHARVFTVQIARRFVGQQHRRAIGKAARDGHALAFSAGDRKSTRLNSSHSQISYAVFCLKKKKWLSRSAQNRDCMSGGGG